MNSKKFKHVILTKYNTQPVNGKLLYDGDVEEADKWMEERAPLFEKTKESILNQGEDFLWVVCIDERTPFRFRDEIDNEEPRIRLFEGDPWEYFIQFPIREPWIITTRLDNDDRHRPGSIKAIQENFTHKDIIIDLCYEQLVLETGKRYTSARPNPNSPFLSLIEENNKPIRTCYARPHNKMSQEGWKAIFASRDIFAYMVLHGNNIGNKIVGEEI